MQTETEKRHPGEADRRNGRTNGSIPSMVMQGFEKMGTRGRRRLFVVGVLMVTAGGGVGLFGEALSLYRFIVVLLFVLGGIGCVFPQWGILMVEFALKLVERMRPSVSLLKRPDRRSPPG